MHQKVITKELELIRDSENGQELSQNYETLVKNKNIDL